MKTSVNTRGRFIASLLFFQDTVSAPQLPFYLGALKVPFLPASATMARIKVQKPSLKFCLYTGCLQEKQAHVRWRDFAPRVHSARPREGHPATLASRGPRCADPGPRSAAPGFPA